MHILYLAPPSHTRPRTGSALEHLGHHVVQSALSAPLPMPTLAAVDAVIVEADGGPAAEACREVRRASELPLLMLTSRRDEVDTITGLAVGADDVTFPPVTVREIDARLRAITRRARAQRSAAAAPDAIIVDPGGLRIDVLRHTVHQGDRPVPLTATEFRLLVVLAQRRGVPQSRETLLELVWGHQYYGRSRIVDNAVRRLRAKIDTPSTVLVHTVRGLGYVLK